ncbi:hypothetical protein [Polaribacter sp.]|uniref:hypothetical protein n=1 Tax=Polaribacter sp. TaxID=1920175 RepID=UPI003F6B2500
MKKSILLILFICQFTSAQKKELYVNDDYVLIGKETYNKNIPGKYFTYFKQENDSLIIYIKSPSIKVGRIKDSVHNKIKYYLKELTNKKIDEKNTIIINYFPENDKCLGNRRWNSSILYKFKKFVKNVKSKENISQFFIFKDESVVKNFKRKFTWYLDKNQIIEKEFFKLHYLCFSYIIIKPNGNYYSKRGEYDINKLLEKIQD